MTVVLQPSTRRRRAWAFLGHAYRLLTLQAPGNLREMILRAPWKASKYVAPHEYVVDKWGSEMHRLVDEVEALVLHHGYQRYFRGRHYASVNIDDHYYWVLPGVGDDTVRILNRARLPVAA